MVRPKPDTTSEREEEQQVDPGPLDAPERHALCGRGFGDVGLHA